MSDCHPGGRAVDPWIGVPIASRWRFLLLGRRSTVGEGIPHILPSCPRHRLRCRLRLPSPHPYWGLRLSSSPPLSSSAAPVSPVASTSPVSPPLVSLPGGISQPSIFAAILLAAGSDEHRRAKYHRYSLFFHREFLFLVFYSAVFGARRTQEQDEVGSLRTVRCCSIPTRRREPVYRLSQESTPKGGSCDIRNRLPIRFPPGLVFGVEEYFSTPLAMPVLPTPVLSSISRDERVRPRLQPHNFTTQIASGDEHGSPLLAAHFRASKYIDIFMRCWQWPLAIARSAPDRPAPAGGHFHGRVPWLHALRERPDMLRHYVLVTMKDLPDRAENAATLQQKLEAICKRKFQDQRVVGAPQ